MNFGSRTIVWAIVGGVFVLSGLLLIYESYRPAIPSAGAFFNLGLIIAAIGGWLFFAYLFSYEIPSGFAVVHRNGKVQAEGWHYGFVPESALVVPTKRSFMEIPGNGLVINLDTPDRGHSWCGGSYLILP